MGQAGCYTYVDSWPASNETPAGTTATGVPAETTLITPTLVTTTSAAAITVGHTLTDLVVATGYGTGPAATPITATWTLLGPVAPASGSCASAVWTGAPTFDTGTFTVTGDGTYTTADSKPIVTSGCYTYVESTVPGGTIAASATTAGAPTESTLVTPTVVTQASSTHATLGATLSDSVIATGFGPKPTATPAAVQWTLLGPVAPVNSSCAPVSWTGAPTFGSGTLTVTGDGTYTTTPAPPLAKLGCYTFVETWSADGTIAAGSTGTGMATETALVTGGGNGQGNGSSSNGGSSISISSGGAGAGLIQADAGRWRRSNWPPLAGATAILAVLVALFVARRRATR